MLLPETVLNSVLFYPSISIQRIELDNKLTTLLHTSFRLLLCPNFPPQHNKGRLEDLEGTCPESTNGLSHLLILRVFFDPLFLQSETIQGGIFTSNQVKMGNLTVFVDSHGDSKSQQIIWWDSESIVECGKDAYSFGESSEMVL